MCVLLTVAILYRHQQHYGDSECQN
jgi:hypothetical protein